jgi:hypothetical protein
VFPAKTDPYALVLSANIHRRHLTPELKRELIANVLKAKPEQSDRVIAKQLNDDHKKVGRVRKKLETTGSLPQLEKTKGADGKERAAKRKADPQVAKDKAEVQELWGRVKEAEAEAKRKPVVTLTKADYSIDERGKLSMPDRLELESTKRKTAAQESFDSPQEAHAPDPFEVERLDTKDAIELGTLYIVWRSVTMAAAAGKKAEVKKELKRLIRAAQKALKSEGSANE